MTRNALSILGIFIAVLPFISIPSSWKTPIYFLAGFIVAYFGYRLSNPKRKHVLTKPPTTRKKKSNGESRYVPVVAEEELVYLEREEKTK